MLTDLTLNLKVRGGAQVATEFNKVESANDSAASGSEEAWQKFANIFEEQMKRTAAAAEKAFSKVQGRAGRGAKKAQEISTTAQAKGILDRLTAARAAAAKHTALMKAQADQAAQIQQASVNRRIAAMKAGLAKSAADAKRAALPLGEALEAVAKDFSSVSRHAKEAGDVMARAADKGRQAWTRMGEATAGVRSGIGSVTRVITGVVAAAGAAAAALGAMADAGAEVALAKEVFASDAIKGSLSDLQRLRDATQGAVSDMKLMQAQSQMSSFGIEAGTQAKMIQLAVGSSKAMGKSIEQMLGDVVTAVARQSVPIADNAGVVITKLGTVYADAAKKLGISTDEMTTQQKQNAFANEMVVKGTKQMALATKVSANAAEVGATIYQNLADTLNMLVFETVASSGVLDVMSSILSRVQDSMGEITPVLSVLADVLTSVLLTAFESIFGILISIMPALVPVLQLVSALTPILAVTAQMVGWLAAQVVRLMSFALLPFAMILRTLAEMAADLARALGSEGMAKQLEGAADGFSKFEKSLLNVGEETKKQTSAMSDQADQMAQSEDATKKLAGSQSALQKMVRDTSGVLVDQTKALSESEKAMKKLVADVQKATIDLSTAVGDDTWVNDADVVAFAGSLEEAGAAVTKLESDLGELGETIAQGGATIGDTFFTQAGKDAAVARGLTLSYLQSLKAAREWIVGAEAQKRLRDAPELGFARRAEFELRVEREKNAELKIITAEHTQMLADANKEIEILETPKKKGKSKGKERRELIFKASLIGLTDVQRELVEIDKELKANLKLAGKNAEAAAASMQIAFARRKDIYRDAALDLGKSAAQQFAEGFKKQMEDAETNVMGAALATAFKKMMPSHEMRRLGIEQIQMMWGGMVERLDSTGLQFRAAMTETIPQAFEGFREASQESRDEFANFVGQFDGEATSKINEELLFLTGAIEETALASTENFGLISEGLFEFTDAFAQLGQAGDEGASATEKNVDALQAMMAALAKSSTGAVAIGKVAAKAFIKDQRALALVYGGFEVAESIKSFATGDIAGGIGHGAAAIKYFAVSGGGAGSAGASSSRKERQRTELSSGSRLLDRRSTGPQVINQNFFSVLDSRPSGEIVMDAINQAAKRDSGAQISSNAVGANNVGGL